MGIWIITVPFDSSYSGFSNQVFYLIAKKLANGNENEGSGRDLWQFPAKVMKDEWRPIRSYVLDGNDNKDDPREGRVLLKNL